MRSASITNLSLEDLCGRLTPEMLNWGGFFGFLLGLPTQGVATFLDPGHSPVCETAWPVPSGWERRGLCWEDAGQAHTWGHQGVRVPLAMSVNPQLDDCWHQNGSVCGQAAC